MIQDQDKRRVEIGCIVSRLSALPDKIENEIANVVQPVAMGFSILRNLVPGVAW